MSGRRMNTTINSILEDAATYNVVADEILHEIEDSMDILADSGVDIEVSNSQGVLEIDVKDHGIWVINKQTPNLQVWWSSPISGPKRFEYFLDHKEWRCSRDKELELTGLLRKEIATVCGIDENDIEI
eukprot:CAMPEP_0117754984 /NCGR_PEP_ID=MMETSP0947-20121206/13175_1 /TAXON_ID=44440 /ORGANISM="Chattonella subsalsa, Strain CCMP2191" /LENGTH=127 /DNA_ID=CAMNT_0005574219 /DNA_START=293 /DNA_END=676 /DNA_ORIENTATION=+